MQGIEAVVVIHAPVGSRRHLCRLWDELLEELSLWGIRPAAVLINPTEESLASLNGKERSLQWILVWNAEGTPNWTELTRRYCRSNQKTEIIALDKSGLLKGGSASDRVATSPPELAENLRTLRNRMHNFAAGFFNANAPYGYKKVPVPGFLVIASNGGRLQKGPHILEPDGPEHAAVVEYIFNAYATQGKSRTTIAHALNAQRVAPPFGAKHWNIIKITGILSDPVYIGANRHKDFIRYNVYMPIIDEAVFYAAQAMLASQVLPRPGLSRRPFADGAHTKGDMKRDEFGRFSGRR